MRLTTLVLLLTGGAMAAHAQDRAAAPVPERMPPVPQSQWTEAQQKAAAEFQAARNTAISGPFSVMLRSPEVMNRARAMGDYLRFNSSLPPRLSEFAILITARRWSQNYEWDAHASLALRGGLSEAIVNALQEDRRPTGMAADEEALYAFCEELHRTQRVSDPIYARALAIFGEKGVIDILGIQGYYTMLAMVLNTAGTPVPGGRAPALTYVPR